MTGRGIVVIGSYNRDTTMTVSALPEAGETVRALALHVSHGGKGSNQAVQAARFGAPVTMIAAIGEDAAGADALAVWRAEGIATDAIARIADLPTGAAMILVDPRGENVIVIAPGANDGLAAELSDAAAAAISGGALVVGQLETPQAATIAAFAIARRSGTPTLLNAAPMSHPLDPSLLALVDILVVNEVEARALALDETLQADQAAAALRSRVGIAVVLTSGAGGATLFQRDGTTIRQPAPATVVVDSTGAGDALIGAFATRWTAGDAPADALRWGVAAGSHACAAPGAMSSLGTMDEIAAGPGTTLGCLMVPEQVGRR